MTQGDTIKPKGAKNTKQMLVRYGRMAQMGWFEHNESQIPKLNTKVVIKTERGMELGEVVGVQNYRAGQFRSTPEEVEAYYGNLGSSSPVGPSGAFVRFATHEDIREQEHLVKSEVEEIACCEKYIKEFKLPMQIIEAEHLFGGERIVYYFTSECRVDFRELVKTLAREYQTRIELRQIGARDEAKLVSDYETCGQQCCCSRYLKILEPVNMRMAKLQKATLDPSKISGHCGRLKCCLRYEDQTYLELKDKLPHRGVMVKTPKNPGRVVDVQILTQLVVVQDALGDRQAWPVADIREMTEADMARPVTPPVKPVYPAAEERSVTREVEDGAPVDQETTARPADSHPRPHHDNRPSRPNDRNNRQGHNRQSDRPRTERPQNTGVAEGAANSAAPANENQGGEQRRKKRHKKRRRSPGGGPNPNPQNNPESNTSVPPSGE